MHPLASPPSPLRRLRVQAARGLRRSASYLAAAAPWAAGFAAALAAFQCWGGVRLLGGFAPGWLIAVLLATTALVVASRYAPVARAVGRRRAGGRAGRVAAVLLYPTRAALLGALLGVVAVRSFHPVRATGIYVVVHIADPANDAGYATELMVQLRTIADDHPDRVVEFATPVLTRLVTDRAVRADDPRCWAELKRQPPAAERLHDLRARLADRVGEAVYLVAVERPSSRVQPWPLWPDRLRNRWLSVDPAAAPRSDRTQLVSYSFNQDAAAAPYLYATLAVKAGDPVPTLIVEVEGGPALRVEASGRFGDHHAYRATVPRHLEVKAIRFEASGAPLRIDALTDLKLAPRLLKVKAGPGTEALRALPLFRDPDSSPIRFVDHDADVEWLAGIQEQLKGPVVELLTGNIPYEAAASAYRLARTPAGVASPLGGIALPKAGAEFRDLSSGALPESPARRLVDLAREPDPPVPLVCLRSATSSGRVTVIVPRADDMPRLEGNVPLALGKLLVWATSLAWRGDRTELEPVLRWELDPSPGDDAPADSGPPDEQATLAAQLLDAFRGRLDGNTRLSAGNSVRTTCEAWAWALLGAVTLLTAGAAVVARASRTANAA